MSTVVLDNKADLAGPGIGDYNELQKVLPHDYQSLLTSLRGRLNKPSFASSATSKTTFARNWAC